MDHRDIVRSCEEDFARFGDTFEGAGWTKTEEQADRRYAVMLDLMPVDTRYSLLDFGCGSARLWDYAIRSGRDHNIEYSGLDLSSTVIEYCRNKHRGCSFYDLDILAGPGDLPLFDAVVLNGVFHYKGEMTQDEMFRYFCDLLLAVRPHATRALAFNVMSTHVEWTRPDLFHLPIEQATDFVEATFGRSFTVRQDYGLYEYTVYVHR